MKTANSLFILLIAITFYLFQCSSKELTEEKVDTDVNKRSVSYIDYSKDTLFYLLNLVSNENENDTFMVTHTLWLEDSCFGSYNDKNWQLIHNYVEKNHIVTNVNISYHIDYLKKGIPINLWNIKNAYHTGQIRLEEGYSEIYQKMGYDSNFFLRIILKTEEERSLSQISLNYSIDKDLNCTFFSKERIHVQKQHEQDTRNIGYCLDTLYKIEGKDIDWYQITDTYAWQVCEGE